MLKKLINIFFESGIYNSKFIYIYSDFRLFFKKRKLFKTKMNKFLNLFLKRGITCITPAFSYTKSGIFNVKKTKSRVGFLSNYMMKNHKFVRSNHPIFSYVAVGKRKKSTQKIR